MGVFYLSHVTFRQTVTNYYVLLKTKYFILKNRISCFAWWTGRSASAGPTFPFGDRQSLCWIDYSGGPLCVPICGKPVLQKGLLTSLTKSPPALLLFSSYFICLLSSFGGTLTTEPSCQYQTPAVNIWVLKSQVFLFHRSQSPGQSSARLIRQNPSSLGGNPH